MNNERADSETREQQHVVLLDGNVNLNGSAMIVAKNQPKPKQAQRKPGFNSFIN